MRFSQGDFQNSLKCIAHVICNLGMDVFGKKLRCRKLAIKLAFFVEVLVIEFYQYFAEDALRYTNINNNLVFVELF